MNLCLECKYFDNSTIVCFNTAGAVWVGEDECTHQPAGEVDEMEFCIASEHDER